MVSVYLVSKEIIWIYSSFCHRIYIRVPLTLYWFSSRSPLNSAVSAGSSTGSYPVLFCWRAFVSFCHLPMIPLQILNLKSRNISILWKGAMGLCEGDILIEGFQKLQTTEIQDWKNSIRTGVRRWKWRGKRNRDWNILSFIPTCSPRLFMFHWIQAKRCFYAVKITGQVGLRWASWKCTMPPWWPVEEEYTGRQGGHLNPC